MREHPNSKRILVIGRNFPGDRDLGFTITPMDIRFYRDDRDKRQGFVEGVRYIPPGRPVRAVVGEFIREFNLHDEPRPTSPIEPNKDTTN